MKDIIHSLIGLVLFASSPFVGNYVANIIQRFAVEDGWVFTMDEGMYVAAICCGMLSGIGVAIFGVLVATGSTIPGFFRWLNTQ